MFGTEELNIGNESKHGAEREMFKLKCKREMLFKPGGGGPQFSVCPTSLNI